MKTLKALWAGWKRVAHKIGNFQARLILSLLYCVVVLPFGLVVRLFGDPLKLKRKPEAWGDYPAETQDLTWAQRQ